MRVLIVAVFVLIIGALAAAGVFMMRDGRQGEPKNKRTARALAVRVGLSVLLFACILLAYWMGWISPTGIPVNR